MDAYKYEPLDPTGTEIRLIKLEPSQQFSAQVRCSIFTVRLEDAPTYNALSYVWGDQSNLICIKLNGCLFPVGVNLYLALRRLRSLAKDVPAVYWVDAICIDQKNDEERGHQVSMMRNIYEGANEVSVWLGEAAQGSALAMALIRLWSTVLCSTLAEDVKEYFLEQPALFAKRSWEATNNLLCRAWWDRVWVYQEIVVSRKAMFICGADILDCDQLFVAILNWLYLSSEASPENLQLIGNLHRSLISRRSFAETSSMLLHRESKRTGHEGLKNYSLTALVSITRYKLATDPRDKIYALLGVDGVGDIAVMPDYTISTSTAYQNFTVNCIEARDNLSIICLGGMETVGMKDLQTRPLGFQISVKRTKEATYLYRGLKGIPLLLPKHIVLFTVSHWETKFSKPGGLCAIQLPTSDQDESGYGDGRPLTPDHLWLDVPIEFVTLLMGFFLAMELSTDVDARESFPAIQHKMELWNKIHEQNSLWARGFALWRGALDEPNIPASDEVLVAPFLSLSGSISPLELQEVLAAISEDAYGYALELVFTRLISAPQNRCFFVSSKGYMGLGPLGTQVGDEICVCLDVSTHCSYEGLEITTWLSGGATCTE